MSFQERRKDVIRKIDATVCIGCGICAEFCPGDVIDMDGQGKAEIRYPKDCWTCFSCEVACPVKAIDVHPFRKPKPMAWPMRPERGKIA
jgi:NAD-dependent dihydropyrimidine dehydrogenase PreA subunit